MNNPEENKNKGADMWICKLWEHHESTNLTRVWIICLKIIEHKFCKAAWVQVIEVLEF